MWNGSTISSLMCSLVYDDLHKAPFSAALSASILLGPYDSITDIKIRDLGKRVRVGTVVSKSKHSGLLFERRKGGDEVYLSSYPRYSRNRLAEFHESAHVDREGLRARLQLSDLVSVMLQSMITCPGRRVRVANLMDMLRNSYA